MAVTRMAARILLTGTVSGWLGVWGGGGVSKGGKWSVWVSLSEERRSDCY
jgi:hypothetical protein